jgi:glycosyltransferase involved in cell wall biosynthesis
VALEVRAGRVDVVDAQGITALGYARLRQRDPASLRAPLVMNPQGMEEHHTRGAKRLALAVLRAASREAAALADRVVATDEVSRADVPRLLGVDAAKVVVLPNGIDLDEIAARTPSSPREVAETAFSALRGAEPVFLSVGRLERYKGFLDIRDALLRLHRDGALGRGWAWVIAGSGPLEAALTGDPALRERVVLAGRVDEPLLHALYARADVFVHAPHFEGSSLVTLEAMAHGLPVVATAAGGIPDKVEEGVTGRLVAPGDVKGLAGALAWLARQPAARRSQGAAGRHRVRTLFSWDVLVERTIALYEELLREAGR